MRAPILALLLLALASSRQAFAAETTDAIAGVQANCLSASSTPALPAEGATTAACEACVEDIGNLSGLASQRMYACYSVCQSPALFPATVTSAADCIDCIKNTDYTVQACKDCMNPDFDAAASAGCYNCLDFDPWFGETLTQAEAYKRDQYFFACSQCSKIPISGDGGVARQQCYDCIKTKDARLQINDGILTYTEFTSPGYQPRDNDFGACVFLANQSYLIATGSVEVEGAYANCVPAANEDAAISVQDCLACMKYVDDAQATDAADVPLRSYGCADYCQDPKAYPAGLTFPSPEVDVLAGLCLGCMYNTDLTSAWACGNCLKTAVPSACYSCVADDPYNGNTSNYNWACGMCAQVEDPALRSLCITCIQSQPGAGDGQINNSTEANICSCIDLVQNNTFSVSRPLTAMERSCYEPFQYYNSAGVLVVPPIPWGNDDVSQIGANNSECLNCMRIASSTDVLPGINKAYACHEYCQNPDLVADEQQGRDCALCVINPLVKDPWGCQTCMTATSNTQERQDCFTCVASTSTFPSHAWGCSQCAQFTNSDAKTACYQCLARDLIDPCACVDGVKNGTITPAPQGPAPGPISVCEHSFASLSCPDYNPITEQQSVITSITSVFYGREAGNTATCPGVCGNSDYCTAGLPTTTCSAQTVFGNVLGPTGIQAGANAQCNGRSSCNVGDFTVSTYKLGSNNGNFGDPCFGVYKYMLFEYECSDVL